MLILQIMMKLSWCRPVLILSLLFAFGHNEISGEHVEYLTRVCRVFSEKYQKMVPPTTDKPNEVPKRKHKQYAVLTLGEIPNLENVHVPREPFEIPTEGWNAWYTGLRVGRDYTHMENALLPTLEPMLKEYINHKLLKLKRNERVTTLDQILPLDIYLYTYYIPCMDEGSTCTKTILWYVDEEIYNALETILSDSRYNKVLSKENILNQMNAITFRLGWSHNAYGVMDRNKQRHDSYQIFKNRQDEKTLTRGMLRFQYYQIDSNECDIPEQDNLRKEN